MAKPKDEAKKTLIIVESPTKAKTIKKFLPSHTQVIACNGHIRDLPKKNIGIDIENGFTPEYVISTGKEKIIKELKSELATSSRLLLATDEDREGESISWHLLQVLKPKVPYQRMVFHEITKKAITHALDNGRELDMALVNAQEARRILDRLYGYTLSPFLWKKLSAPTLSAGRVQSPGLRLIVEKERERIAFKQALYADVVASLHTSGHQSLNFEAKLEAIDDVKIATGKDFDPLTGSLVHPHKVKLVELDTAQKIAKEVEKEQWKVVNISEKEKKNRPSPPFITSTLQQEGSRKLHLSAKDTMKVAQKLYESGLITYMRTDSPSLSSEGIKGARDAAGKLFGLDYLSPSPRTYTAKSASAQEAHEAIRPAGEIFIHPEDTKLHGKEFALYDMIWKRTLATQMADAIKATTSVKFSVLNYTFGASGNRIVFPGFIRVYVEGKDDPESALEDIEKILPPLTKESIIDVVETKEVSHETKPSARYTEATLVQELEKQGIGRPSTYASIIDKLFEKKYVVKENNALIPTFIGFAVIQLLEQNFETLVDYNFTSNMEQELDNIARETVNQNKFLSSFYEGDKGLNKLVKEKMESVDITDAKQIVLPQLSPSFNILVGKFGPYVKSKEGEAEFSASIPANLYPGTITDEDLNTIITSKKEGPDVIEPTFHHPETGAPIYFLNGRFGPYFQLGEKGDKNNPPKNASVPKGKDGSTMSLEEVLFILSLPKVLGIDPETKEEVKVGVGKYGPYISRGKNFTSVSNFDILYTITLEKALELANTPKSGRGGKGSSAEPVKSFGEVEGKALAIFSGRFGLYGKYGKDNFALENEMKKDPSALETLTQEKMLEMFHNYTPKEKPKKKTTRKKTTK